MTIAKIKYRVDPARRTRTQFSASQVDLFRSCKRKWFLHYVCGVRSPSSPSQELGTKVHAEFEGYLLTGSWPGQDARALQIAQAALKNLPKPGPDLLVEHEFWLPLGAGRTMYGLIDLAHPRDLAEGVLKIRDHKTSKDFVWNKTPAELQRNVQANVYAWWGYTLKTQPRLFAVPPTEAWRPAWDEGIDVVDFAHNYVKTERPLGTALVSTPMPFEKVSAEWVKIQSDVDEMTELALEGPSDPLGVPGNKDSCDAYGGCHFGCGRRGVGFCQDIVDADLFKRIRSAQEEKEMEKKAMNIRERLAARKAAQQGGTAPAAPAAPKAPEEPGAGPADQCDAEAQALAGAQPEAPESAPPATGVVAPDAPGREQTAEEAAALAPPEKVKKRAAQKKAGKTVGAAAQAAAPSVEQVADAEAKVQEKADEVKAKLDAQAPDKAPSIAPPGGLKLLYVDNLPTDAALFRTTFGDDLTPIEKWLDPIKRAVAQEFGEADYALIEFGKGKAALAAAINACIDQMPKLAYVSSFSRSADVVIDAAIANGWLVSKATRG